MTDHDEEKMGEKNVKKRESKAFLAEIVTKAEDTKKRLSKVYRSYEFDVTGQSNAKRSEGFVYQMGKMKGRLTFPAHMSGFGTGGVVWTGGIALAKCLEHWGDSMIRGKRVLELGAGSGLVGLVARCLGAKRVVLTDLPDVLPIIRANVEHNRDTVSQYCADDGAKGAGIRISPLIWGKTKLDEFEGQFDCILASEVIYESIHAELLIGVLRKLVSPSCTAVVSFDLRGRVGVKEFISTAPKFFHFRSIGESEWHGDLKGFSHLGIAELRYKEQ